MVIRKFQQAFYPGEHILEDENGIGFKERTKFLQYNLSKPNKWHLKVFSLCDAETEYLWNAFP